MLKRRRRLFRHLPEITFCLFSLRKKTGATIFLKLQMFAVFFAPKSGINKAAVFALKCSILYGKSCHSIQCYEISKNQLVFKCIEKYTTTTSAHTHNTDFNCHRKMDKAMLELFVLPQIASLCCSVWNFILLTKNLNIHWFQRSLKSL